jgi:hypothetical protein
LWSDAGTRLFNVTLVGLRMKSPDSKAIENRVKSGEVIRKHVMEPTWHLIHQNDIRWMLELSAPNVKKQCSMMLKMKD